MNKSYPYPFETFTNEYKDKSKDFFIEKGFKYRLLIQSRWYRYTRTRDGNTSTQWKQRFRMIIEDLNSGHKYSTSTWTMPFKRSIKLFLKTQLE